LPKVFKAFRFGPQLYLNFKELAGKNGYTVTGALEKFMADAVRFGFVFPTAKNAATEAEASTRGRLLQLLPKVEDADLRMDSEETLKKMSSPFEVFPLILKGKLKNFRVAYEGICSATELS
jgi:hypothetical protein